MVNIEKVKSDIISFLKNENADVGNAFNMLSFFHSKALHYNPKEKDAVDKAFALLVDEGIFEVKEQNYILTEHGVDTIY
jgi:hypothetical protein